MDGARALVFAPDGALRAPWRVVLFVLLVAVAGVVVTSLVAPLIEPLLVALGIGSATRAVVTVLALLLAHAVMLRWVERRPWSWVWLGDDAARPGRWAGGFAIGLVAVGVPILLLVLLGWIRRAPVAGAESWAGAAARVSAFLLPAALLEELMTRGYVLAVLRESAGPLAAVLGTSLFFGVMHVLNPGATVGSTALVTLAGIFLGAVVIVTRSLYAAWMAHFAWNWTMAVLFHTAVSGLWLETPRYRYVDAGPDWATGGAWGPEGGVPAGFGMIGGLTFLIARRRRALRSAGREES